MDFSYKFPAVKGLQAKKHYYIAMLPLKYLGKMFPSDDDIVMPEYRAQRKLNLTRIPEISSYILNNRDNYIFSALAASIDGDFEFSPIEPSGKLGILEIDMDARILINDGQHRKAAIIEAIAEDKTLLEETISIVFYKDDGLVKSQQMFADLNKHAVKPSNSLSALYDVRDPASGIARYIVDNVQFFNKYTELESDSLGVNSPKFFTLNHLKTATEKILKNSEYSEEDKSFVISFWSAVVDNITEWNEVMNKEIPKKTLKESYIITLGVILKALGKIGSYYYEKKDAQFKELTKLIEIDWLRSNKQWKERLIREDGKVMSSEQAIMLTCNKIKQLIGIPLTKEEQRKEKLLHL